LLRRAGLGIARATVIVTVVLAGIEALQTRIPGHVAEINDPLLAVLLCLGLRVLYAHREAVTNAENVNQPTPPLLRPQ
jgi:hypothetical protein